jgi:hypothetical protein
VTYVTGHCVPRNAPFRVLRIEGNAVLEGMLRHVTLLTLVACSDPGPATLGDPLDDPQVPPRGSADITTWIAEGYHLGWACEPAPHAGRSPSPHGRNRICSNDALLASTGDGPYPVGAAAVKEIYDGERISLHAVYRKVVDGTGGDTWYWFEGSADEVIANGEGDGTCTGCHSGAPRDFVFTPVIE